MGFFSFNSEFLSLSDTVKTNRGRRGMLSNRNTGSRAPGAWASPRGQAGGRDGSPRRGAQGLGWNLRGAPLPPPPAPLRAPGRFAHWWARIPQSAPCCQRAPPQLPLRRGPPGARTLHPLFWKEGGAPGPASSPPGSFSLQPGRGAACPASPRACTAPAAGRGENKDPWRREAEAGGGPAHFGSDRLAGVWPGARPAAPRTGQCLTCGEAAEKDGEGRPESQG